MKKIKNIFPFFITFIVIILFYIKRFVFLKFYPPVCNFLAFMVFFGSLFSSETIILKIAKACKDKINEKTVKYTRNVTYVWCVVTFLNFIISIWTIFLPDKIWIIFNGCICYVLMGLTFIIEYVIRLNLRKKGQI